MRHQGRLGVHDGEKQERETREWRSEKVEQTLRWKTLHLQRRPDLEREIEHVKDKKRHERAEAKDSEVDRKEVRRTAEDISSIAKNRLEAMAMATPRCRKHNQPVRATR